MPIKPIPVKLKSNFWITPAIYAVTFFILAVLSMMADRYLAENDYFKHIPSVFLTDKELSHTILSATSTSLLTMTTITFSSVLVVLTTFLANFSPRTMHNFNSDSKIQRVLGVFIGGYIYSLVLLNQVRENEISNFFFVPTLAIIVAFICVGMFVFLIHHMTEWIKVGNVISTITKETLSSIEDKKRTDDPEEDFSLDNLNIIEIKSRHEGYIQDISLEEMVDFAEKKQLVISFNKDQGDYVNAETPLLTVSSEGASVHQDEILKYITFNTDHESKNDIEFGIQKIAEIALRGIAPGKNDPETAIACIEHLAQILTKIGKNHSPSPYHRDRKNEIRIVLPKPTFTDYLYESFYQIRHYGKEDVSVMASVLKALILVAETNRTEIKQEVWEFSAYIYEGIKQQDWLSLDKTLLNKQLKKLAKVCLAEEKERVL
jgi:uncharacterized membrane protein